MNKKMSVISLGSAVILLGAGCSGLSPQTPAAPTQTTGYSPSAQMTEPSAANTQDTMPTTDTTAGDALNGVQAGRYETYDTSKLLYAQNGKVVLFFKAGWCSECRVADLDISKNVGNIPSELSILKVDYDSSADLRKKYGVTYQHTFVQVDAQGNMLKKWSGSETLGDIVAKIR